MCAPNAKCVDSQGKRISKKQHCPPGQCDVQNRLVGPHGHGWMIYECSKCGCFEGL